VNVTVPVVLNGVRNTQFSHPALTSGAVFRLTQSHCCPGPPDTLTVRVDPLATVTAVLLPFTVRRGVGVGAGVEPS
jgi:hypothetical protein